FSDRYERRRGTRVPSHGDETGLFRLLPDWRTGKLSCTSWFAQTTHIEREAVKSIVRLLLLVGLFSALPSDASAWCKHARVAPVGGGGFLMPAMVPVGVAGG